MVEYWRGSSGSPRGDLLFWEINQWTKNIRLTCEHVNIVVEISDISDMEHKQQNNIVDGLLMVEFHQFIIIGKVRMEGRSYGQGRRCFWQWKLRSQPIPQGQLSPKTSLLHKKRLQVGTALALR